MKKQRKRYPLSAKPLHHAGQSLDDLYVEYRFSRILVWLMLLFLLIQLLRDWWYWHQRVVYSPLPEAIFVGIIGIGVLYFDRILRTKAKSSKLGSEGEKITAQDIDNLKILGCSVYHDVVAHDKKYKFNIDHIVISSRGIFAVETKTFSKPLKGLPKAHYDGRKIVRSGGEFDTGSIEEAKFHAKWLEEQIFTIVGSRIPVTPVVVYPEWLVEEYTGRNVWILNPKRLLHYVENQPITLKESDISIIISRLGQFPFLDL